MTNKQVAADLGVDQPTVDRWLARFVAERPDGLQDEQRSGQPPSILLDQVEDVIVATLESTPAKGTHWSRASMTARTGPQIDHRADLEEVRPQVAPADTFKLTTDPHFVDKVVDVVGLYHDPPEKAVALYMARRHKPRPWTAPNQ
ncbi:helix-turn-helix domain-containing protein [Streptomyces sp. NPDC001027]|uniref:helix-turn-helix domain-containing protein n=1 Tax=Streptomyces sp. NPDC001027 TaxID=3154771 RepID=UPI00332CF5F9